MNITFLLGNGFDIGLGLKTRYTDFYEVYCKQKENDNDNIAIFKREIRSGLNKNKEIKNWADFEREFGKHSCDFSIEEKSQYIERFEDFVTNFNEYLEEEEKNANFSDTKKISEKMLSAITTYFHIREGEKNKIQLLYNNNPSQRVYNFVSFNYTRSVDKCAEILKRSLTRESNRGVGTVMHIHGYIDANMIMGVNDPSQIKNETFANDPEVVSEIVKPKQNADSWTTYDSKLVDLIYSSDIICVYGMSIGETDKKWWDLISIWLTKRSSNALVILSHEKNFDMRFPFSQRKCIEPVLQRFLHFSSLNEENKKSISSRIYIGINHNVFEMNLRQDTLSLTPALKEPVTLS